MSDDFLQLPDLASRTVDGCVVSANDEWFAPRQSLITPGPASHAPEVYGHTGKVYDGWETRRRRDAGHDWAIVRLGIPGIVHGVVVDTAFFTGNFPPFIAVDAASIAGYPDADALSAMAWTPLVPRTECRGDSRNLYAVADRQRWTHLRLRIYPDGGVARFRVHGEAVVDPSLLPSSFDLLALENGGRVLDASNAFYSSPVNLIAADRPRNMGEGWENSRRRGPGNDWVLFALAARGVPELVEVDSSYFIGNAPGSARISAIDATAADLDEPEAWWEVVSRTALLPDTRHRFVPTERRPATHLRLDVYPDGGLARLRCYGSLLRADRAALVTRFQALLPTTHHVEAARRLLSD